MVANLGSESNLVYISYKINDLSKSVKSLFFWITFLFPFAIGLFFTELVCPYVPCRGCDAGDAKDVCGK